MRRTLLAASLLACASLARAAAPSSINYQGVLKNTGVPVTGYLPMEFKLMDAGCAGATLWTSGVQTVYVATGAFSVTLTPDVADWSAVAPSLRAVVDGHALGCEPVASAPYAFFASTAGAVATGAISDAQVSAGAAIAASKIAGGAMTLSAPATVSAVKTFDADLVFDAQAGGRLSSPANQPVAVATNVVIESGWLGVGTTAPSGPLHVVAGGDDALFVDAQTGFVGVGVSTPQARLQIDGPLQFTGVGTQLVFPDGSGLDKAASIGRVTTLSNSGNLVVSAGNGSLYYRLNGVEKLRVSRAGDVGVGDFSVTTPTAKLQLALGATHLAFSSNAAGAYLIALPGAASRSLSLFSAGDPTALGGELANPHRSYGAALTLAGGAAGRDAVLSAPAAGAIRFRQAGVDQFTISSAGVSLAQAVVLNPADGASVQLTGNLLRDSSTSGDYGLLLGYGHTASADFATLLGGELNDVSAVYGTVTGGFSNAASGPYGLAGGGVGNVAGGDYGAVLGGTNGAASGLGSLVVGGDFNVASGDYSVVLGGAGNTASGDHSAVGGGDSNSALGEAAVVAGGLANAAAAASFAGGRRAKAVHAGSFVWADSQDADFASTAANQVSLRAQGGLFVRGTGEAPLLTVNATGAGIGTGDPKSALQLQSGYLQLATHGDDPNVLLGEACDGVYGRMIVNTANATLCFCALSGWVCK
jgi:hypothetical protein